MNYEAFGGLNLLFKNKKWIINIAATFFFSSFFLNERISDKILFESNPVTMSSH